jgi:hypothetical protein
VVVVVVWMHELPPEHQALEDWEEEETAAAKQVVLLNLVFQIQAEGEEERQSVLIQSAATAAPASSS